MPDAIESLLNVEKNRGGLNAVVEIVADSVH